MKQENKETNLHLRCVLKSFTNQIKMARLFRYNLFAIFAILSSTAVLVSSLPTSVLVDAKQQQNEQTSTAALNKGNKSNFARDFFNLIFGFISANNGKIETKPQMYFVAILWIEDSVFKQFYVFISI